MYLIPAIDILGGKCVRLTQGDYDRQKVYNEDPLEVAKAFEDAGMERLHLVDLDGARSKHIVNYRVLESIAASTGLQIDFGGGIKSDDDLRIAFESGAHQVTGGTVAVKEPSRFLDWLQTHGSERIILGADFKEGKIAVSGWAESTDQDVYTFLKGYFDQGIRYSISTDVAKDGLLGGTALETYERIAAQLPDLRLIASGGICSLSELNRLHAVGCYGAIIGKALYEGLLPLKELQKWMDNHLEN